MEEDQPNSTNPPSHISNQREYDHLKLRPPFSPLPPVPKNWLQIFMVMILIKIRRRVRKAIPSLNGTELKNLCQYLNIILISVNVCFYMCENLNCQHC
jgi:hypothetical protein